MFSASDTEANIYICSCVWGITSPVCSVDFSCDLQTVERVGVAEAR